jgi:hypothetical protein
MQKLRSSLQTLAINKEWRPGRELNPRRPAFQGCALPKLSVDSAIAQKTYLILSSCLKPKWSHAVQRRASEICLRSTRLQTLRETLMFQRPCSTQSILKGNTNAVKKFIHPATAGSENKMGRLDSGSGLAIIAATRPQAAAADSHNPGTARLPVT